MCRTRTGLAVCANVLRRALIARFLPLDFAQTANPILVLPGGCATRRARTLCLSRQAVSGGGDFAGRLKKSAWSRSA
jgi:hypothetical protein